MGVRVQGMRFREGYIQELGFRVGGVGLRCSGFRD